MVKKVAFNSQKSEETLSTENTNNSRISKVPTYKNKLKKSHFGKNRGLDIQNKFTCLLNESKRPIQSDFSTKISENDFTFENEIPGGFDNVDAISGCDENDKNSCYVAQEDLIIKPYIGLDWEDISVNSDSEFQYCPEKNLSYDKKKIKCMQCGYHFKNKEELNAHQIGH